MAAKKHTEINPDHSIVENLRQRSHTDASKFDEIFPILSLLHRYDGDVVVGGGGGGDGGDGDIVVCLLYIVITA